MAYTYSFQFPLHRDPRCNEIRRVYELGLMKFQFPLHRDPRCNFDVYSNSSLHQHVSVPFTSGSSLQPAAAIGPLLLVGVSVPFTSGSSLQPAAAIGPLLLVGVSVPFTSGSSLQQGQIINMKKRTRFSSLYIGILAATDIPTYHPDDYYMFQFPLHRDPRCNEIRRVYELGLMKFQFPLHRDPRCNTTLLRSGLEHHRFSSLYIGILAATQPY